MVKRHYGIVTQDYKLAHFYYDVDEWELYDRKKDPSEMKNVYEDPAYSEIVKELGRIHHALVLLQFLYHCLLFFIISKALPCIAKRTRTHGNRIPSHTSCLYRVCDSIDCHVPHI